MNDKDLRAAIDSVLFLKTNPAMPAIPLLPEDDDVPEIIGKIIALFQHQTALKEVEARIDELEMLAATQDQEVDLDGKPLGKPYPVMNDGADYIISNRITYLKAQRDKLLERGGE